MNNAKWVRMPLIQPWMSSGLQSDVIIQIAVHLYDLPAVPDPVDALS